MSRRGVSRIGIVWIFLSVSVSDVGCLHGVQSAKAAMMTDNVWTGVGVLIGLVPTEVRFRRVTRTAIAPRAANVSTINVLRVRQGIPASEIPRAALGVVSRWCLFADQACSATVDDASR